MVRRPDESVARELAARAFGEEPQSIRRFTTGEMHYVYEAGLAEGRRVVIRIAAEHGHKAMRDAAHLSRLLRPRGVPLPAILEENLDPPFPHLILERLPGTDLGQVIGTLSPRQLEELAASVLAAQNITAQTVPSHGRFGYAASSETAPHASWPDVLAAHLDRSRARIASAGLFDVRELEPLASWLDAARPDLAAIPATPFLHDTTTKNVIVTPAGTLSGIVDVDDLCFGDPRYVVALTQIALVTRGLPTTYTEAWLRRAGFAEDGPYRLYLALFLADFMAERGQVFNGNEAPADREHDARLLHLFRFSLTPPAPPN